jgi:uncharacterized protein YjbJ (UPF0337 family)
MPDQNVIEGKLKQAEGKVQDALGDVTGNSDTKAEGQVKQVEGKVQEGYGKAKDAVRDAFDDNR